MSFENYVLEALERALAMDISEYVLGQAVNDQAALMAHVGSDQWGESGQD